MSYRETFGSYFTIVAGVVAVLVFDLATPIENWIKIAFTVIVIAGVVITALLLWRRKKGGPILFDSLLPHGPYEDRELTNEELRALDNPFWRFWKCKRYNYRD